MLMADLQKLNSYYYCESLSNDRNRLKPQGEGGFEGTGKEFSGRVIEPLEDRAAFRDLCIDRSLGAIDHVLKSRFEPTIQESCGSDGQCYL